MSEHLQKRIDNHFMAITHDGGGLGDKPSFKDFSRVLIDGDFDIDLNHAAQIFAIMDIHASEGSLSPFDQASTLRAFVEKIEDEETDGCGTVDRILIEYAGICLENIKNKGSFPITTGRRLFDFFARYAMSIGDEAFSAIIANSRVLTAFTEDSCSNRNILLECSNNFFKSQNSANLAITAFMDHASLFVRDGFDLYSGSDAAKEKREAVEYFARFIGRIDSLGIKIQMHAADILLISGLLRLLLDASKSTEAELQEFSNICANAALSSVKVFTQDEVRGSDMNMFKYPVRRKNIRGRKETWLLGMYMGMLDDDIARVMPLLSSASKDSVVEQPVKDFMLKILLNYVQAEKHFLVEKKAPAVIANCVGDHLLMKDSLKGLRKDERITLFKHITNHATKVKLLEQYRSDSGAVARQDFEL